MNMSDFILSCSSTADLSQEFFDEKNIKYIYFHFELDGKQYMDDLGKSVPFKEFYNQMANDADTKTSQINEIEYTEYFEKFLKEGKDILHLTLSSGISGTYNSARLAAEELREKYPERKLYVVDSLNASSGFGLLVSDLADKRDAGMGIDELYNWVEENKLNYHAWFFCTDLKYLIKGGRVSKTAGIIGGMLNICPLLNVNFEGKLIPRAKIRTKKKVIKETVNVMMQHVEDGANYTGDCFISHSDCYEDARAVADLIEENIPNLKGKVKIFWIGTTIGSHTGPGTVAVFFRGDKKID